MSTMYDGLDLPLRAFRLAGAVRKDRPMTDDLDTWGRAQLDADAETFNALDSTALNGIESTAGWDVREYVERGRAEVDAKRRILDEYEKAFDRRRRHPEDLASAGALLEMVSVVKLLFLPYADRPGYREEWRP